MAPYDDAKRSGTHCGDTFTPDGWRCTRIFGHTGACAAVHGGLQIQASGGSIVQDVYVEASDGERDVTTVRRATWFAFGFAVGILGAVVLMWGWS